MTDEPSESRPDDLRRNVTRSVGWVVLERWSSRLLTLLVFAVLTRLLDPADFGVIALATASTAVLQVFVDSGFTKALVQVKTLERKDASTAFWISIGISVALYIALVFASPLLAAMLGEPRLSQILPVLGLSLPIMALSLAPAALLERDFDFKLLSIRQLVAAAAGAMVAIPVALLGGGVWALVAQVLCTAVVSVVVLWASSPWRPRFEFSIASLRKLWPVGASIMGTELLDALQGNIDKIVIGAFFSADVLGYYYLAQRVGTILIELVTSVMSRVSLTTFSRLQSDLPRLNRVFRQMTFAASAVGVPIFGMVALLAPQIVPLVFGPGWEPSIQVIVLLAPGWALGAAMYFDRAALLATGNARSAFSLAVLQNAVGTVLVFALLPLGLLGVIISRWARIFTWPARLWVLHRTIDLVVWRYLLQIGRCILIFLPIGVAIGLLQLTPWAQGPASAFSFALPVGLLGMTVYAAATFFFAGKENRAVLDPAVKKLLSKVRGRR